MQSFNFVAVSIDDLNRSWSQVVVGDIQRFQIGAWTQILEHILQSFIINFVIDQVQMLQLARKVNGYPLQNVIGNVGTVQLQSMQVIVTFKSQGKKLLIACYEAHPKDLDTSELSEIFQLWPSQVVLAQIQLDWIGHQLND